MVSCEEQLIYAEGVTQHSPGLVNSQPQRAMVRNRFAVVLWMQESKIWLMRISQSPAAFSVNPTSDPLPHPASLPRLTHPGVASRRNVPSRVGMARARR